MLTLIELPGHRIVIGNKWSGLLVGTELGTVPRRSRWPLIYKRDVLSVSFENIGNWRLRIGTLHLRTTALA